jgi:zinc transport system permease protein
LLLVLDQEMAEVSGIPVSMVYYLLVTLISLTIVISIKVVGIVLVSALLIIPSAAALQITNNFKKALVTAIIFGIASSIGGLILSYFLDTPSGATIVLFATGIFLVTSLLSSKKRD